MNLSYYNRSIVLQLPPLRAMENPADYDIDKDMQNENELDETKIGKIGR